MTTRPATDALPATGGALARAVRSVPLSAVWAVAAVAVPVALAGAARLSAVDVAYHLRAGRIMLDAGDVLRQDVFTVWGGPWLNQQWGAQVLLATAFGAGGWFGLALMRSVAAVSVLAMLYASCRNAGASPRWAAGLTMSAGVLATGAFIARPQLLGVVCLATTQWMLSRRERHPRSVWWALPVTVVWANTHGSFFLAPVLFALAWARDRERGASCRLPLLLAGLATLPLALVNPFGVRVWGYAASFAGDERIRTEVAEWQPPTLETLSGALFLASVVAVRLFVGARVRRIRWPALAGLGLFLVLGLTSIRGGLWWYLAVPVLLAGIRGADRPRDPVDARGPVNAVLIAVLGVMALAPLVRWLPHSGPEVPERLVRSAPVAMSDALDDVLEPGEPVFAAQPWGSWFELALPENPVFVDSRWEARGTPTATCPRRARAGRRSSTATASRRWRSRTGRRRASCRSFETTRDGRSCTRTRAAPPSFEPDGSITPCPAYAERRTEVPWNAEYRRDRARPYLSKRHSANRKRLARTRGKEVTCSRSSRRV